MNKLRLNIDGRMKTDEPFVIQISSKPQTFNSNFCASYARQDEKVQVWCIHGEFSFTLSKKDSIEDDICIVFPETQQLIRQYRAHSNSNTLLITEQCDQTCLMCSQPPKNKFYDDYDLYIQVMKLTPVKSVIGISGGEPLLEKNKLFLFIDKILAIRPDLQFHILTNAQHFGMEDLSFIKNTKNNIVWCIPLYSSNPTLHDDIVCKVGAYKQLLKSLNILFVAGSIVELRTVLIKQNQWELPK
ncbi:MAG: His-Xaa-Ser system radical SAM maturase HxsC, partial [Gammaproteobacteria bacterium]|nr:His-Xaa-Ser system radical SAM maturase HxsC [Gammaproteobacteria bacterium]